MANDFSGDENCVALWKFESGALTADSKGTNTLLNYPGGSPTENTSDYKEGSCAANTTSAGESSKCFYIPDANLSAGFPLKSGDTVKKISVCGWFKYNTITNYGGPFGKGDYGNATQSLWSLFTFSDARWVSQMSHTDGDQSEILYLGTGANLAQTGRWYHYGFTFDDSDKSWKLVVWDDTAGSKVVDASGNAVHNINVENASVRVSGVGSFAEINVLGPIEGLIDEIVVFKDILTATEIDKIRAGTYGAAGRTSFIMPFSG